MKPITLAEAAEFLRMSRSSLYQRKDIPRYRRPRSRVILFDQEELEAWLRRGRIGQELQHTEAAALQHETEAGSPAIEILDKPVYHRLARYR